MLPQMSQTEKTFNMAIRIPTQILNRTEFAYAELSKLMPRRDLESYIGMTAARGSVNVAPGELRQTDKPQIMDRERSRGLDEFSENILGATMARFPARA